MSFFEKKKTHKKDVVLIVTFDQKLIGLLPTNHIIAYNYYNGVPEFVKKRSMLTEKYLKQREIFEISLSESRIYKKWQTSAIIREISDSNLETGRNGLKCGVSRIIWKG